MKLNKCTEALRAVGVLGKAGHTAEETAAALCLAAQRHVDYEPVVGMTPALVGKMFASRWANLTKAVEGGITHFLSVDNGAYYAELWSQGENYYAVTGADQDARDRTVQKGGIWQVPGVVRGMNAQDAVPLFLKALEEGRFGGQVGKNRGCGC